MKLTFQIFSAVSFGVSAIFAFRVFRMFAPGEYNEFTGIVVMLPAAGCIVTFLLAILFFGLSLVNRRHREEPAGSQITKAEQDGDTKPDKVPS